MDERVARESAQGVGVEAMTAERFAEPDCFTRVGRGIDGHHEVRPVRAPTLAVEVVTVDIGHRIRAELTGRAQVVLRAGAFDRALERRVGKRGAFGIEHAVDESEPTDRARVVEVPPVIVGGLATVGAVAIEIRVERIAPLPTDVRDILRTTLTRDVDQHRFEHCELRRPSRHDAPASTRRHDGY